jgi:hypothetical protein
MTQAESSLDRALKLALALFPAGPAQPEDIERNCDSVLFMLQARQEEVPDRDTLIREIESRIVVWQDEASTLENSAGHEDWLAGARSEITWSFCGSPRIVEGFPMRLPGRRPRCSRS